MDSSFGAEILRVGAGSRWFSPSGDFGAAALGAVSPPGAVTLLPFGSALL